MEQYHINLSGKKVRLLREQYRISQTDLACETNVEQKTICKIESDKYKHITLCTSYKIAKYFNVSIESLIK
jgi:DNA-binding XRE family transcriptional regulator